MKKKIASQIDNYVFKPRDSIVQHFRAVFILQFSLMKDKTQKDWHFKR